MPWLGDTPARVLIVEDNADAAQSLAVLMDLWGHEARVCRTPHYALVTSRTFRPHVVLLDCKRPVNPVSSGT